MDGPWVTVPECTGDYSTFINEDGEPEIVSEDPPNCIGNREQYEQPTPEQDP